MLEFEEIQEIKPNIEILEQLKNYNYTVKNGKISTYCILTYNL